MKERYITSTKFTSEQDQTSFPDVRTFLQVMIIQCLRNAVNL